jgi:tetratricopeptide (TPR) repeat protein
MTTRDPNERLPTDRGRGQADPTTMRGDDDSPDTTGSIPSLDPAGQALFERIGAKLGLPIAVQEQRIGRFVIRGQLGVGGMGVVYRAYDPKLDREVALKLIHARAFAKLDVLRARLLQEAKVLAQLEHPNVVRVYEVDEHEGEVFVALQLVAGPDLRGWQRAESPAAEQILRVFVEAGRGLAAAHAREIIHRDFKPDNVLIAGDGRVLVGDFGLAGSIAAFPPKDEASDSAVHERLTDIGEVIGTTGYMPPEQLRGDDIDARSDQYAFCVSLWELLTGDRPFTDKTRAGLLAAMSGGAPSGGEGLPRWLRAVLIRGLSPDPKRRFPSMLALVGRLEQGLARKRRRLLAGGLGLAAIVTITSLIMAMYQQKPPECEPEQALEALRESDDWRALEVRLDAEGMSGVVTPLMTKYERRIAALCPTSKEADKQHLSMWIQALGLIAESAAKRDIGDVVADIRELGSAQHDQPPPTRIDDDVRDALLGSEQAEREDRLDDALTLANEALEHAKNPAERALALIRRGRVEMRLGNDEAAIGEFEEAYLAANRASYPEANLRASLLKAKTAIMRLDRLDQGEEWLHIAESHLDQLNEPIESRRWTDFHQLDATLSKHRGDFPRAWDRQYWVLLRTFLALDRYEFGLALVNLGTLWETAGDAEQAEGFYRLALVLLPEPSPHRRQAEQNLGRLLVFGDDPSEVRLAEARELLREVVDAQADQLVSATYSLAVALMLSGDIEGYWAAADDLAQLLLQNVPSTSRQRFDAWEVIAAAQAERNLDYGHAAKQVYELAEQLPASADELARFEIQMIDSLGIEHAHAYVARLRARLPELSSANRMELESALESLSEPVIASTPD